MLTVLSILFPDKNVKKFLNQDAHCNRLVIWHKIVFIVFWENNQK